MTKSWVAGDRNSEVIEKLREQISELETRRNELMEKNKRKVFDWAYYVLNSPRVPGDVDELRNDAAAQEVKDAIALYELLNRQIMDNEVSLNDKLDEQTRNDTLG
ncbi:MAG: hypothetical protein JRN09_07460 [Nitrososphaerota archaeon]|nr:hypothetical protein [Nitrososphaerota archaeon]